MTKTKRQKIASAGPDTLTGRNRLFLESKGWRVDDSSPYRTSVRMKKDDKPYFYFLLASGHVRRGETRGKSVSVKLKLEVPNGNG